MTDLVKICAAFALIVLLLRLRWNFGIIMVLAAAFLGSLYRIGSAFSWRYSVSKPAWRPPYRLLYLPTILVLTAGPIGLWF